MARPHLADAYLTLHAAARTGTSGSTGRSNIGPRARARWERADTAVVRSPGSATARRLPSAVAVRVCDARRSRPRPCRGESPHDRAAEAAAGHARAQHVRIALREGDQPVDAGTDTS
jgi:hypothetical protein